MKSRGRLFPKGGADAARPTDAPPSTTPSPPSGPMTRARAKLLQAKVNSLLSSCDFGLPLDGLLLHASTLCILRYEATPPHQATKEAGPGEEAAGALHTGVSGVDRSLRSDFSTTVGKWFVEGAAYKKGPLSSSSSCLSCSRTPTPLEPPNLQDLFI